MKLNIPYTSTLHVTIGAFDGVHKAHKKLIARVVDEASKNNDTSLVLTFEPLPKEVLPHEKFEGRLLPASVKQYMLSQQNPNFLIVENFKDIRYLSEDQFIRSLLKYAEKVIFYAGPDFHIGCKEGIRYIGQNVDIIHEPDIIINGFICRSSVIRDLIKNGSVDVAAKLLGYEYTYYGRTISGSQVGRTIDFPTINLQSSNQITPGFGVYFGEILLFGETRPCAAYVGTRPSLRGLDLRMEAHIIDGKPVPSIPESTQTALRLIEKISEEKTLESLENLRKMLYNYKEISLGLATERYKIQKAPPFPECER
ncbi:riboflavin kinase / FMN adenylyltransferase [Brevinema andersonii]|uniref:Riboflavin biosynthesis protein n=1 Tax=Brevinema andersonii TaxID=34097 RepID=A0A1I1D784_BREAD|nr:riboflavin kinase [Brevinema andersonii]SFB70869.1 riboflavin kinase / FMN adenylyltransferase [Brevinema andersonii]